MTYDDITTVTFKILKALYNLCSPIQEMLNNGKISPKDFHHLKDLESLNYSVSAEIKNFRLSFFLGEKGLLPDMNRPRHSFTFTIYPEKVNLFCSMVKKVGVDNFEQKTLNIQSWDNLSLRRNESSNEAYEFYLYDGYDKIGEVPNLNDFNLVILKLLTIVNEFVENVNGK